MPKLNENYLKLNANYLFSEIAHRVSAYQEAHPDKSIVRLGIGDVTLPLSEKVTKALVDASAEMGDAKTFKGYGPDYGFTFLQDAIVDYYKSNGVTVDRDEVFVSDGAKSDTGNIGDLFAEDNVVLIPDPVYPVYVDTNTMAGRNITYIQATAENNFLPLPDENQKVDIIYICSPNNPTGAAYNKEQLKIWVDYAIKNEAIILYDSAYECFISDPTLPRSIFAVEGARKCAIEFCSLSKTAGFTGTRCGYTVVPKELCFKVSTGEMQSVNAMWKRRQSTKFNGVAYIVQKGAAEVFTPEGMKQCRENIAYYQENARLIGELLTEKGIRYFGAVNSPYIWLECPDHMNSWDFFDKLLNEIQVVGTPGAGFGKNGTYFFRLTGFGSREATLEAIKRLRTIL